jgi:hypothetical protein
VDRNAAQKLVDLLESAEPEDRRAITAWLLERPAAPTAVPPDLDLMVQFGPPPIGALQRVGTAWLGSGERTERLRGALAPGEESQLVTLRLPQERHAQLRRWCTEHDFSMAAVIRGLVEQFLEARGADRPAPE